MASHPPRRVRLALLPLLVALALGLAACGPEGARERGGSEGADVGNREDAIEMHGEEQRDDRIYYQTPGDGPEAED